MKRSPGQNFKMDDLAKLPSNNMLCCEKFLETETLHLYLFFQIRYMYIFRTGNESFSSAKGGTNFWFSLCGLNVCFFNPVTENYCMFVAWSFKKNADFIIYISYTYGRG